MNIAHIFVWVIAAALCLANIPNSDTISEFILSVLGFLLGSTMIAVEYSEYEAEKRFFRQLEKLGEVP